MTYDWPTSLWMGLGWHEFICFDDITKMRLAGILKMKEMEMFWCLVFVGKTCLQHVGNASKDDCALWYQAYLNLEGVILKTVVGFV